MTIAPNAPARQLATLGGGCFWCLDPVFAELNGVTQVTVGYAGGRQSDPTYHMVCTGTTGHAEVVQVEFDPAQISFDEILRIFFSVHDPTTLNRQGADVGSQYRSVIFYHDQAQKETAEAVIRELDTAGAWRDPIVTEIQPFTAFYPAEDYHQQYFLKNPYQGYCQVIIAPKLSKFRKTYTARLKSNPPE